MHSAEPHGEAAIVKVFGLRGLRRTKGSRRTLAIVRALVLAVLLGLVLAGVLSGCSVTPAQREAIRKAWADRDAERAADCYRNHVGFAAGGCVSPGGA
jgi:DNA-binding GntR family transcriptional regulator